MIEELDDNEFFQQDFTTASEWEIFNARLEEIFHEWKLPFVEQSENLTKNQLSLCDWEITSENIFFADFELSVTRYRAKIDSLEKRNEIDKLKENTACQAFKDLISTENNYCIIDDKAENTIHPIARWYGLRDFVIVSPAKTSVSNESQIRILYSSIHIAVSESNCEVPVFIHVLDKIQNVYLGVCECRSTRLNFDIVHLNTTPATCKYVSGLLCMFKSKIGVQYVDHIIVSVRLSYSLTKFISTKYLSTKKIAFVYDDDEDAEKNSGSNEKFCILPFGSSVDPVVEIILYCTWPNVVESLVVDCPFNSNLDPALAQDLSIRIRCEEVPVCFMSECLSEFLNLTESRRTLPELLGDSFVYGTNLNLEKNPFDVLTESKIPSITSVIPKLSSKSDTKKVQKAEGPLDEEQLMNMLYYLFPDAQKHPDHPYQPFVEDEQFDPLKIKTAHPDSLVQRLSCLLSLCNTEYGGIKAVAQFWAEFSQEMRYRVENCVQIPGVAKGFPDSRTCLLHQKLQMLNVCMERRRIREGGLPFSMTDSSIEISDDEDAEDDEFFDCSDEDEENKRTGKKPEGRLTKIGNMTLVDSEESLYIPITQEPVPKTEDQLEDDAEVMLKLGPGSELRAQMMSASLLSDMESFKAANPNGKLEDFIRWYSPRDWIEENNDENEDEDAGTTHSKGHLSSRMLIPGNTWQTVWSQAKPVPARRQKRLFDDAKEAEKVLHFLETQTIAKIAQLTISSLFHASIIRLQEELNANAIDSEIELDNIEKVVTNCCKLSRENWVPKSSNLRIYSNKKWECLLSDITNIEYAVEQIRSIKLKLFNNFDNPDKYGKEIIANLLKGYEVDLKNGIKDKIAVRIFSMFYEAKKAQNEQSLTMENRDDNNVNMSLPNPIEKQFTLRVQGNTINKGPGGPQFLRAILGNNEFRLCGAFSQDTTFY